MTRLGTSPYASPPLASPGGVRPSWVAHFPFHQCVRDLLGRVRRHKETVPDRHLGERVNRRPTATMRRNGNRVFNLEHVNTFVLSQGYVCMGGGIVKDSVSYVAGDCAEIAGHFFCPAAGQAGHCRFAGSEHQPDNKTSLCKRGFVSGLCAPDISSRTADIGARNG